MVLRAKELEKRQIEMKNPRRKSSGTGECTELVDTLEERIKALEWENEKLRHEANRAKLLEEELNKYKEKYEVVETLAEAYKAHRDSLPTAKFPHGYPYNPNWENV